jgi:hypothetical protein
MFTPRQMSVQPSRAIRATQSGDGRRTAIAFVSAALISVALLACMAIFDVR